MTSLFGLNMYFDHTLAQRIGSEKVLSQNWSHPLWSVYCRWYRVSSWVTRSVVRMWK